jgi:DNA-binding NarL/FixJ family response regulator
MSAKKQQEETGGLPGEHFGPLVPDEVKAAYAKLFEAGRIPKEEAAEFLGDPELLEELNKWGMAHTVPHTASSPASYRAVSPHLSLMAVLGIWQARIAHEHQMVFEGYQRLIDAQAVPAMDTDAVPHHLVEVLRNPDDINAKSWDVLNMARRDFMSLDTADFEMPVTPDVPVKGPPELCRQLRMRGIYDVRFAENPAAREAIESCIRDGEEARVLRDVPMKLKLADQTVVMMPMTESGTKGALVITAPPIVRASRVLCELLWQQATPFGSGPAVGPLTDRERKIFQILARGGSDETAARELKCSSKTVGRDVDDAVGKLGLVNPSRFQLGYMLASRGWLDAPARDSADGEVRSA